MCAASSPGPEPHAMRRFETLLSTAAPLPDANVDTDTIFPARFLLHATRSGLGGFLFHDRRFRRDNTPNPEFALNREPFCNARILVAGENFGCGSSREQAVWALADYGIACIIAPSFGEIFRTNCFKSGVLAATTSATDHAEIIAHAARGEVLAVDLQRRTIGLGTRSHRFEVDAFQRRCLLEGLDEVGLILAEDGAAIAAHEANTRRSAPWLFLGPGGGERAKE